MPDKMNLLSRRNAVRQTVAAAGLSAIFKMTEGPAEAQARGGRGGGQGPAGGAGQAPPGAPGGAGRTGPLNKLSTPSDLRITDMRAITVAANFDFPIIRIDTNQGVYGLGDVRDAGLAGTALILKPELVGRNPLEIDAILRRIRPYAGDGRFGGGYSAVDIALHDLAGKVYGVPSWRLIGSQLRNNIRIYCDTTGHNDPRKYGERMRRRKALGFTWFKMQLNVRFVQDRPGAIRDGNVLTDKGLEYLGEMAQAARDAIGWDVPLGVDSLLATSVNDAIRYCKALEKYQPSWVEDLLGTPNFRNWRGYKAIKDSTTCPLLTGEDAFGLEEGFLPLLDNDAIDLIHPDPLSSGGFAETKRIADYAHMRGVQTVIHMAGSPVAAIAGAHMASVLPNFLVMENHAVDMPWWQDLVTGVPKPLIEKGYMRVPNGPGLGVELNEPVVKEHLRYPGFFEPTPSFDRRIVGGGQGGPYPHFDEDGVWVNVQSNKY